MNKKKILSLALVVLLIATISFGTLAWFNDSKEVKNTFYVASSDAPVSPDDIFSVELKEYIDSNNDGVLEETPNQDGHNFNDIMPGQTIVKNPVVTNTGMYDQWIRVTITFADIDAWYALQDGDTASGPVKLLNLGDEWIFAGLNYEDQDAYVYTYYLNKVLEPNESVNVFTKLKIPSGLEQKDVTGISGREISLTIKAEAVQVDHLEAKNASDAFKEVNWEVGTEYDT